MTSPSLAFASRRDVAAPPGFERAFCAYRIPYLPAPLPPREGADQQAAELARAMFRDQAQVIASLGRWQEQAIALRYFYRPETRTVEMTLLLRTLAPYGQAAAAVDQMGRELTQGLARGGIATSPVGTEAEVLGLLMPPGHIYVAEVRQQEAVVPLRVGGAYAVYPLRPPLSTWQSIFAQFVRQDATCVINVHLQPTRLSPAERNVFAEAAAIARTIEDFSYTGYTTVQHSDPLASVVGNLYANYLQRLSDPYLVAVQVVSPDYRAVQTITQALAAELSERMDIHAAKATGALPAGAQVMIPGNANDAALAQHTLTLMELQPWGDAATRSEQRRLPFLMDAATTAAAFRFPVAVDGRIPGVATRAMAPGVGGRPIGKIFLSYRRGDTAGTTGRIYDRLAERYGKDAIFMDVASLEVGVDFMERIQRAIAESAVQLVLLGPSWLDAGDAEGHRRLEQVQDPVRREVEAGLTSRAIVIPVLLDGTPMPASERLPESIQRLCALNSSPVRHADFDHDMERLIAALDEQLRQGAEAAR